MPEKRPPKSPAKPKSLPSKARWNAQFEEWMVRVSGDDKKGVYRFYLPDGPLRSTTEGYLDGETFVLDGTNTAYTREGVLEYEGVWVRGERRDIRWTRPSPHFTYEHDENIWTIRQTFAKGKPQSTRYFSAEGDELDDNGRMLVDPPAPPFTAAAPRFIAASGVLDAPLDFAWKGAQGHIGPVETVNAMFKLIGSKTTCGMLTLAAGFISWGAWRLRGHTEVDPLLHLIEASFAFQVHPDYVARDRLTTYEPVDDPPAESAAMELQHLLYRGLSKDKWWHSYWQPVDSAFHSSYVVSHIMPKKVRRRFGDWRRALIDRVAAIAPKPDEPHLDSDQLDALPMQEQLAYWKRHWGEPLPPEILDLESDFAPNERAALVDRFLRRLDWKKNPFLRAPEVMKRVGFEGTPYRLE